MKTFIQRSVLGIFFGSFLALLMIFAIIYIGKKETLDSAILAKNALGSIACGWFYTVTPLFFENERLSLSRATLYHFISVCILFFFVGFWVGWVPFTGVAIAGFGLLFLVIYAIIWTAFYLYFRKTADKLNEELNGL